MWLKKWKPKLAKGSPREPRSTNLRYLGKDGQDLPTENYLTVTTPINYIAARKLNPKIK